MKVEKTCVVCGKSFLAANPLYCLCSNDCRAKRKTVYKKRYEKTHVEAIREQRRKRNEKYREQHKNKHHCKTCGTVLPNGCQKYCLDCLLKEYQKAENEYQAKRESAKAEYSKLVAQGKVRPKTSLERAFDKAHGHPDNASTQAARRMLAKRGYDWKTGKKIADN